MNAGSLVRALAPLALAGCGSCVWYPDRGHLEGMRGAIPATARAALVPGRATRADVLLELGEPDWSSADEARLLFWTHEVESVGIVYLVVEGAGLTWGEDRFLLFEFDEKGLLRSQRERTRSFSSEQGLGRLPDEAECAKLFEEAPAAPGVRTP